MPDNQKFFHSVYLDTDKCCGCITCIKTCPTQAIRVRNGKAHIIKEFCIDCGECIRHCPHYAKQARFDHMDALENYKYKVALPPPSLYGQFNHLDDINIILTALTMIGFDDVFEVGAAAELVSAETRKYIAEHEEPRILISTACPTVTRLIRIRFPELLDNLLPLKPPVEVAAELARQRAVEQTGLKPEEIGIAFISPCPSKVTAVRDPLGITNSSIDVVLATKEIYPLMLSAMKEAKNNPMEYCLSGKIGVGWGLTGGEAAGILLDNYIAADGIENVVRVLEDLEDEKFQMDIRFVELNACPGGCVGGVLNVENPFAASSKLKHLKKYLPVALSHPEDFPQKTDIALTDEITYEPVYMLGTSMLESINNMVRLEKIMRVLPGLDCGGCGAPTCKALAEDHIRGKGDVHSCTELLRRYYLYGEDAFEELEEENSL